MTALLVNTITARCDVEPGWIHINAPFVMKPRMDSLRAKWDAEKRMFRVPLTWANCLALRTELGADLTLDDSLKAWGTAYRAQAQTLLNLRQRHDRWTISPNLPGFDTLFAHQRSGVDLVIQSRNLHRTLNDGMGARYLVLDETGVGKGVPLTAKVLTPTGWVPASLIREGDSLIGRDGQPTKVEGAYLQPIQQTYRVTFSDGVSVVTDGPHLWTVQSSNDQTRGNVWRTMSTEELSRQVTTASGRARWRIPLLSAPVEFDQATDLPMNPYALGVVLGDGYLRGNGAEVNTDKEILESIGIEDPTPRPGCWYGLVAVPDSLGLNGRHSWDKFVPPVYLTASPADRLAILQGLMDTDGTPLPKGGTEFSSTSEQLVDDVVDLAQSLGGTARKKGPRYTRYTYKGDEHEGRLSWRVNVKLPDGMQPFRLARKATDWLAPTKYPVTRIIKSIKVEGRQPTICFRVAASDSLFVIDHYVVTHNTRVALGAIAQLQASPVIILCPKSVIRSWHDEAKVFFPDADIREVHGTAVQRRKMLVPGGDLYIMSYDSLRTHSRILGYPSADPLTEEQRRPKEIQALDAKMLVVDEVHRCASPRTQQTRAAWAVADDVEHVVAMTGTPIQESPEDLWAVLRLLDRKTFPGITAFRDRYLDMVINPYGGWDVRGLNPTTRHEFLDLFHTMSRRAEKADVLPYLPPKVYETRWVELPPDNRRAYKQMEKQYLLEVESGQITAASNPMVAAGRLIQLANATIDVLPAATPDGEEQVLLVNPSPKVKAFMADIDAGDFADTSVVVFSDSRKLIGLLAQAFDEHHPAIPYVSITGDTTTDERNDAIKRFQNGEVRYILITRAGDTGITLTKASVMVRLVRSWSYITHVQAEDRVHRIGSEQHDSITYIDYVTEDTVEEGQIARLNSKKEKATEVLHPDELRAMMKREST